MAFQKGSIKQLALPAAILVLAAVASVGIYFARTEQYKSWEPAPGVVQRIQITSSHSRRSHSKRHRIYYSYVVDGQNYAGDMLYSGARTDFAEGDSTQVWYNPKNPAESSFHKPGPGLDPSAPIILGIPLALAAFRAANSRRGISKESI